MLLPAVTGDAFTCPNCDTAAEGEYCGRCGQKRVRRGDLRVAHAWRHLVDELTDVDGRIFRTLRVLFTKPGQLTVDFLAGRRARYVHPLRLFLVISGIYFLVEAQTISPSRLLYGEPGRTVRDAVKVQAARGGGGSYDERMADIDRRIRVIFKVASIGTVVVNGLWFWVLFRRSHPYVAEHMVTSLHLSAVTMTATMFAGWLGRPIGGEAWMGGAVAGLTQVYGWRAFSRIYPDHKIAGTVAIVTTIVIDYALVIGISILALRLIAGLPIF